MTRIRFRYNSDTNNHKYRNAAYKTLQKMDKNISLNTFIQFIQYIKINFGSAYFQMIDKNSISILKHKTYYFKITV